MDRLFDLEDLKVYQASIEFSAWLEDGFGEMNTKAPYMVIRKELQPVSR